MKLLRDMLSTAGALAVLFSAAQGHAQGSAVRDTAITASERDAVIDAALRALQDGYFDPAVARRMTDAVRARQRRGAYDHVVRAVALAESLTTHLRAVSHDKHVGVDYSADALPPMGGDGPPSAELVALRQRRARLANHGVTRLERLDGNVGYLKIDAFFDPGEGGNTIAAAMAFLANTDALIIDLRDNHGGRPTMVALLASYFLDGEPVHLNDIWMRDGNQTRQSWSLAYVPGPRYLGRPVYLLTSHETISAGEEFANDLKVAQRVTIVGDTTAGGANPGGAVRISDHFAIFVPRGRAINPVTNTNWEGTGVAPDVLAPSATALETARVLALHAILAGRPGPELRREAAEALAQARGDAPAPR